MAGAHRTVTFILGKERCNLSDVFQKAIETDCVGWGPKLAIQPMDLPFVVKTMMAGMGFPFACHSTRMCFDREIEIADSMA